MNEVTAKVILVCPVCASPVDAEAKQEQQTHECISCGQSWIMTINLDRHAEHAL